jgi:hypothetical protein
MELVSLDQSVWNINVVVKKELNHTNLNGISLWFILEFFVIRLNSYIGIVEHAFNYEIFVLTLDFESLIEVVWVFFYVVLVNQLSGITNLEFLNVHLSFCDCSCFTNTQVMEHSS